MKNQWFIGKSKAKGVYCDQSFQGIINGSFGDGRLGCILEIALDIPLDIYGERREYILVDSESVEVIS